RPKVTRFIDEAREGRCGLKIAEIYAVTQLGECRLTRRAFHLGPIDLGELVTWIRYACLQCAVVRQQQQSFTVGIEAASGVHAREVDVVGKRAAAGFGAKLADHTKRLVESNQHVESAEEAVDQVRRHGCDRHRDKRRTGALMPAAATTASRARLEPLAHVGIKT